jgi:hypothetical protein
LKIVKLLLKTRNISEGAVDRSETDIRNMVGTREVFHDDLPDEVRGDLAAAFDLDVAFDLGDELFELVLGDRALLVGLANAGFQLGTAVGFFSAVSFDDRQVQNLDFFIGGEAETAFQAFATASDGGTVVDKAGVSDFRVHVVARGAFHSRERVLRSKKRGSRVFCVGFFSNGWDSFSLIFYI